MKEHFFQCPYCWKEISMLLDPTIAEQDYIEDCENCCRPIKIRAIFQNRQLMDFSAQDLEQ